ncbi:MAG: hypothetical protein ABI556_15220 [Gemmatimonadales bacterium]
MMYSDETELTPDEIVALSALPREMQPSDLLEERVVHALRSEGNFGAAPRSKRNSGAWVALRIAAALALFAGGVATGRYLLGSDTPQSASVPAPATIVRDRDTTTPNPETRTVNRNRETVVAEREMWL